MGLNVSQEKNRNGLRENVPLLAIVTAETPHASTEFFHGVPMQDNCLDFLKNYI